MAVIALTDAYCYVAGHDFTGDSNALTLNNEAAELNRTNFRSGGWTELAGGGLKTGAFSMGGFWQSATTDAVDPQAFTDLGVADRVFTFGPTEVEGAPAYMWQGGHFNYQLLGNVGELAPFTLAAAGTSSVGVVRGQLAKAKGTVNATGVLGSVVNLGTVGAGQYLYATLHVLGAPGTTITVQLQSDDTSGFASPTTRATLGPLTAASGVWATRVAGALAETHYRFNVSAITGTFTVAGAIGIQ